MNLDELRKSNMIIYDVIAGSFSYGTNIQGSDKDQRGIFIYPFREYCKLIDPNPQISDKKMDLCYYSLKRFFELIVTANPSLIELLWTPSDSILYCKESMKFLIKNRDIFITKKTYFSHASYAHSQISKASGKNKKVHSKDRYFNSVGLEKLGKLFDQGRISSEWVENRFSQNFLQYLLKGRTPILTSEIVFRQMDECLLDKDIQALLPPRYIDYCYFVKDSVDGFPMRPVRLSETVIDLRQYNCSSMEHVGHVFRLYFYGDSASGVFGSGEIVCSSIPMEDEKVKFSGLMIYGHNEYESDKKEWRSYWEWMSQRNENRWRNSELEGEFQYDAKNMQHTIRLLLSCENIVVNGEPTVRFCGEKLKFLRDIRERRYDYDYLMKFTSDKLNELRELFEKSSLPDAVDTKVVNELYLQLTDM